MTINYAPTTSERIDSKVARLFESALTYAEFYTCGEFDRVGPTAPIANLLEPGRDAAVPPCSSLSPPDGQRHRYNEIIMPGRGSVTVVGSVANGDLEGFQFCRQGIS